ISVGPEKIDVERTELPDEEYRKEFMGEFGRLSEEDKIKLLEEVLTPNGYNMMVTPKEVDLDISDLSEVISGAIDRSLHTIVDNGIIA
ncbi:MAG: GPR endopeptidase, partial [Bacilli bacterium]